MCISLASITLVGNFAPFTSQNDDFITTGWARSKVTETNGILLESFHHQMHSYEAIWKNNGFRSPVPNTLQQLKINITRILDAISPQTLAVVENIRHISDNCLERDGRHVEHGPYTYSEHKTNYYYLCGTFNWYSPLNTLLLLYLNKIIFIQNEFQFMCKCTSSFGYLTSGPPWFTLYANWRWVILAWVIDVVWLRAFICIRVHL